MDESGMRHSCQPTVSLVLWHQSLQGWGSVWCCPTWSMCCSFRTTIYVETSRYIWVSTLQCHCYSRSLSLQGTRGISNYFHFIDLGKTMPQSNLLDHKVFPIHDPIRQWKKGHCDHYRLSPRHFIQQKQVNNIVEEHKKNESLPYVQHKSIGHDSFQVCLGFQPLAPNIGIALLFVSSPTESSHTHTKVDHAARYVGWIQHLQ